MSQTISPLAIRKATFKTKIKGLDPLAVEEYLTVVADELARVLQENDRLQREREHLTGRLEAGAQREQALQETLFQAQRMSDEIIGNARREAQVVVREAEHTADKIVGQAMDHTTRLETKVAELRQHRRELQARCRAQVELFSRLLDEDIEEERAAATIRTLRAPRRENSGA